MFKQLESWLEREGRIAAAILWLIVALIMLARPG